MRRLAFFCLLLTTALGLQAQPVSLFDGKTLTGWDYDPAVWRVEDGVMTGGSLTEMVRQNYFISTNKSYQNFDLKLKIKCSGDPATGMLNSGIQIRSLRVPGGHHMSGYQVDCGKGWFGKIYDEFRRNKVIAEPLDAAALDKAVDVYGWNEYRIRAEGPRIQVWINGVAAIDYTETDKNIALDGQLGPQVHSGGACLVQVKDITIEELPSTPGAPTWQSLGGVEAARKLVAPPPKPKAKAGAAKKSKGGRDISYNAVTGEPKTAAEQQKLFHLPEGYEIELVVQESDGIGKFVSVYFDQRGRMWTQTAFEYPVDANENPAAAEAVYNSPGKDKVLVYPREALNAPLPSGGLSNPTVYADGLAIPLGILPWGNGDACYIQHGHDLKLFKDTDGDGKADTHEVILTGFGVQDSHLFPHQFTRAPGGWIWMAQGLFNNSQVHKPGSDQIVDYPKCGMARMRPDGSEFEVTSVGPNNIWGLVITGEGETFIQEANDYGYPVMPFHEYAYYPGGMEALKKSYQPDFPPQAEFRMGGTGLSGLALIESGPLLDPAAAHTMAVANPITSKVQTLAMHRDGPYWKLEQKPDLITCDDPYFRPVALTNGPDGCLYIVDWYNKIISHNEVPRAHPDRDKTRGRIWRIRRSVVPALAGNSASLPAKAGTTAPIPDFTKLSTEELIAILGTQPTARAHLAWQTLADRDHADSAPTYIMLAQNESKDLASRIQAMWCLAELGMPMAGTSLAATATASPSSSIRVQDWKMRGNAWSYESEMNSELAEVFPKKLPYDDSSPEVRQTIIKELHRSLEVATHPKAQERLIQTLLTFAKPSLTNGPTTQSSRAPKQIPVREAYDREFERFLVRMFLERHPEAVARFLDSESAASLPVEARVLAALALEPKASAARVAKLLPQLDRAPNDGELLRLAQFLDEPGVGEALKALLTNPQSREAVAEKLLAQRTQLDAAKIAPILKDAARSMLQSDDLAARKQALALCSGFQITSAEEAVILPIIDRQNLIFYGKFVPLDTSGELLLRLNALAAMRSGEAQVFYVLAESDPDPALREAALTALIASSTNVVESACERLFKLYPKLNPADRKRVLNALSGQAEGGAKSLLTAIFDKTVPQSDLDGPVIERLATVLADDPELAKLQAQLGGTFQEVLMLDGSEEAWVDSKITLEGPFTMEAWVRLTGSITNQDGLLGLPGKIDMNFHDSKFRVWLVDQRPHDVVVARKPVTPGLWTHVAVTRDAKGIFNIYQDGELDATSTRTSTASFEACRLAWTGAKGGTEGAITEFRVWNQERTAAQIRANFDRVIEAGTDGLLYKTSKVTSQGARLAKTLDAPPLLTEEQAKALDEKFIRYTSLAAKGNAEKGKPLAALCIACHQIGNTGGQIGPNLSGAGAMGLEAVLRNILTPNAAMEPGYRIYRVEMVNGDLIDAFFVSEDAQATIIRQPGLPDRRISKKDIRSTRYIRRSLMPEGLLDALPEDSAADLLAYLMTLKG